MWFIFSRVYLRIDGEAYDEYVTELISLNPMELIREVAIVNPEGDGENLYNEAQDEVFEGRTKRFIVHKTQQFIAGMPEIFGCEENMALYASGRQLKNLIRAFTDSKKKISCYGLIYVYVIYTLLQGKSPRASECADYLHSLYVLVERYLENHPDDELASFFYGCFEPLHKAVIEENINLSNTELPPRPRRDSVLPPTENTNDTCT